MRRHVLLGGLATLGGLLLYLIFPIVFPGTARGGHRPPIAYMVPVYPFFGFALAEFTLRGWSKANVAQVLTLTVLAFARMAATIPASGHVMMMVWFLLAMRDLEPPILRRVELALAVAALGGFLVVKLFFWQDVVSPALGALLGALIYLPGWLAARRPV